MTYRYADEITEKKISGWQFFSLRLSRLYPVHVLTLLMVFTIYSISFKLNGSTPIYGNFDSYHFGLNLLMLQKLVFDKGYSFNGPSWSVSVECFLYFVFYVLLTYAPKWRIPGAVIFSCMGLYFMVLDPSSYAGRGLFGFYFGSVFYQILLKNLHDRKDLTIDLAALATLFICLIGGSIARGSFSQFVGSYFGYCIFVFPIVIYASMIVPWFGSIFETRPFLWLGAISYSLYLVHVPIQMILLLVEQQSDLKFPSDRPWFAVLYGLTITGAAWVTHVFFEKPAKTYLRNKMAAWVAPG